MQNNEFEKARFYSDEERKERENLRALGVKYSLDQSSIGIVGADDIADVVSRWTGYPITSIKDGSAVNEEYVDMPPRSEHSSRFLDSLRLRVFMCHASNDKPAVRDLYLQLKQAEFEPWFDAENLIGGQEWRYEIEKAVRSSHVVLVCISKQSVEKSGFLNKEIKIALDVADQQPEGTIFIIPLRLEECEVPDRLKTWQWIDFYKEKGFEKLTRALTERGRSLGIGMKE